MNEVGENKGPAAFDWRDALVLAALVAVILLYFRRILWTNEYVYGELDIRRSLYFFKKVSYDLMHAGDLPLWNQYLYCGMPLLGGALVTPFYPVDLALMLTGAPLNKVFNWELLIHLMAAQVFSYLLFKRLFIHRVAAAFGAMWFWNVFFLNSIETGDALNIRAMLLAPVVFYFVEAGMSDSGRPRDFLFGSLALSMQVLCGGLQNTFYTMAAIAAYAAFRLVCRARRGDEVARPAIGFSAMMIVGLALSAVQLLPAWEYSRLSVRSTSIEWFKIWALKPYQLIGYVVPMFEGRGSEHGYFGLAPIVLAAYSLPLWKSPRKYFFLALGTLFIVYSFGGNTLVSSYIAGLPILRGFRGPFRGAIFFNLSVFVLACGALVGLLDSADTGRQGRGPLAFGAVAAALIGGFVATSVCASGYPGFRVPVAVASAAFGALSIVAVLVLRFSARFRTPAALALVLLLVVDLAVNHGRSYSPSKVSEAFERDWSIDFLESERNDAPLRIAAYNTAHTNYFGLFGFESANGHHPFPTTRYAMFLPLLKTPSIASLAGVSYTAIYARDEDGRPLGPPVERAEDVSFHKAPLVPLPRAFLVDEFKVLPEAGILDAMRDRRFDPGREVILEKVPTGFKPAEDSSIRGAASVVSRDANGVVIETQSERDAILVLTESYYPGWKAEVDGASAEILRADYVFRAVTVPAGGHRVEFRFRPTSFLLGAAFSCGGIIAWLAWALALFLRRGAGAFGEEILEPAD